MKLSDGLFLESARTVARDYSEIAYEKRIVDAVCMQLVMNPSQFVLRHIGEDTVADRIMAALVSVLTAGGVRTRDLGGTATTTEFAGAICRTLETADE